MLKEKFRAGLKYGIIAIVVTLVSLTTFDILKHFGIVGEIPSTLSETDLTNQPVLFVLFVLFGIVVLSPAIEETLFRLMPIGFVFLMGGDKNRFVLWAVIVVSSVIFGWAHGSWHHIFIQGAQGIVFSVSFLKGGYISSFISHAVLNLMVVTLFFIGYFFNSPGILF